MAVSSTNTQATSNQNGYKLPTSNSEGQDAVLREIQAVQEQIAAALGPTDSLSQEQSFLLLMRTVLESTEQSLLAGELGVEEASTITKEISTLIKLIPSEAEGEGELQAQENEIKNNNAITIVNDPNDPRFGQVVVTPEAVDGNQFPFLPLALQTVQDPNTPFSIEIGGQTVSSQEDLDFLPDGSPLKATLSEGFEVLDNYKNELDEILEDVDQSLQEITAANTATANLNQLKLEAENTGQPVQLTPELKAFFEERPDLLPEGKDINDNFSAEEIGNLESRVNDYAAEQSQLNEQQELELQRLTGLISSVFQLLTNIARTFGEASGGVSRAIGG